MIPYWIYKIVHIVGIMMIFLSLGGVATHAINGGSKVHRWKRPLLITHGFGMVLALIGGFGLLARLGVSHGGLPGWIIAKLGIWLIFGGLISVLIRKPAWNQTIWILMLVLGGTAAYLAGSKPF